tara:strand:- start:21250 stop:22287 length:1038 start_codon:yes stop_codon:yes gene_type:complete
MRTVLAAAAIAKGSGKKCPVMQPVGLHFRVRHHYRTDMWVEFGEPHYLPEDDIPEDLIQAVQKREWVEPPGDLVRSLRDGLRPHLSPITPNVSSWDEHGAFHLVAQLESRMLNQPLDTWRKEVLAARQVRDRYQTEPEDEDGKPTPTHHPIVEMAKDVHLQLEECGLDGRDLDAKGERLRTGNPLRGIGFGLKTAFMAMLLPVFLLSLSPQLVLGRFLGDRTDEGVDARTTYQFLAAMFGSVILWPFMAFVGAGILWLNSGDISAITSIDVRTMFGNESMHYVGAFVLLYVSMIPLFWASGRMFGLWWDGYVDARRAFARIFVSGTYKQTLNEKLKNLKGELQSS